MRILRRIGLALLALAAVFLLSFAVPLRGWRTGERPHPPFALLPRGSMPPLPRRVWIDTDAACGQPGRTDPDDCFAVLLLAQRPALQIVGVSTVFGNAPLDATDSITHGLVDVLARSRHGAPAVHRGSAEWLRNGAAVPAPPAHAALRAAIEEGPLTILALGPLTNVAAALEACTSRDRDRAHVVAVMGRRPGHLFHPAEGARGGILFGQGPVFRDYNFDLDPEAAARVLTMAHDITLIPYEVARQVQVTSADLDSMTAAGGAPAWVAERSRAWLHYWRDDIGTDGFYPFDLLAAAYVSHPDAFGCARVAAWISDGPLPLVWNRTELLVGQSGPDGAGVRVAGTALYCTEVDAELSPRLRLDLIHWRPVPEPPPS